MGPNYVLFNVRNSLQVAEVRQDGGIDVSEVEGRNIHDLANEMGITLKKAKEVAYILRDDISLKFLEDEVDHTVMITYDSYTHSLVYAWAKPNKNLDAFKKSFGTRVAMERAGNIIESKYPVISDISNETQLKYMLPKGVYNNLSYYLGRGIRYFKDKEILNVKIFAKIYDPTEEATHCFTLDVKKSNIVL